VTDRRADMPIYGALWFKNFPNTAAALGQRESLTKVIMKSIKYKATDYIFSNRFHMFPKRLLLLQYVSFILTKNYKI